MIRQYEIHRVCLDPTIGHEIKKTRPCVVISPDELNSRIGTVIIAPLTSGGKDYPSRVPIRFQERDGWIVLDQIRTVDRRRMIERLGEVDSVTVRSIKTVLKEMLVD